MRGIIEFFGSLWRSAMFWRISPIEGVRTGSSLAGCLMFMVMVFTVVAIILVLLGFDLDEVDRWLDAQGGWIDFVASVVFRGFVWAVFLFCVLCCCVVAYVMFSDRESRESFWGLLLGFSIPAFIAWFLSASLFAPLSG